MSYQPLARKYRPQKFSDLVGQEAVVRALKNAFALGREPVAVIFSGVRGVGKTTLARLYSKALNCKSRQDGEPCDVCENCRAINSGRHEDVLEIDGASHNGVAELKALLETVDYATQRSVYKVYLIDEVHMLSISAFNALLKVVEEPPSNTVFIFATTELGKVPQTVISRCQTFHLKKISLAVCAERIKTILRAEGTAFEEGAVLTVAKEGRGSLRDSLTFLDQALALGGGELSSSALAEAGLGFSTADLVSLVIALLERDAKRCLELISAFNQSGIDFTDLLEELAGLLRSGMVLRELGAAGINRSLIVLNDAEIQKLSSKLPKVELHEFNRLFRSVIKCRGDLDGSELDRFIFENYCLEWCCDPGLPTLDESLAGGVSAGAGAVERRGEVSSPATESPLSIVDGVSESDLVAPLPPMPVQEPPPIVPTSIPVQEPVAAPELKPVETDEAERNSVDEDAPDLSLGSRLLDPEPVKISEPAQSKPKPKPKPNPKPKKTKSPSISTSTNTDAGTPLKEELPVVESFDEPVFDDSVSDVSFVEDEAPPLEESHSSQAAWEGPQTWQELLEMTRTMPLDMQMFLPQEARLIFYSADKIVIEVPPESDMFVSKWKESGFQDSFTKDFKYALDFSGDFEVRLVEGGADAIEEANKRKAEAKLQADNKRREEIMEHPSVAGFREQFDAEVEITLKDD